MALAQLTQPSADPVSLGEVKQHLRIETDDDDAYLSDLIKVSTKHLEAVSGLKLITQTWRQYTDCVPDLNIFRLEVEPVQAAPAMRYYDNAGTPTEIAAGSLLLDGVSSPPRLTVNEALVPHRNTNGIEIDIIAGYGDTPVDVPDALKRALLLLIAHAYEFRGAVPVSQQPASEPHGFRALLAPFRRIHL